MHADTLGTGVAELEKDRDRLSRSSTADRVASILRDRITEGFFLPGTRLSEDSIGEALGISRNTLREAFRLLAHERLLVHELNRGVFVRTLTTDDVAELFCLRRIIECAAVRELGSAPDESLQAVRDAVAEGELAASEDRWADVATANMHFHQGIVGLAGSRYLDKLMGHALAELRLVFHVAKNARRLHKPYLSRNGELLAVLETGDALAAEHFLTTYLADAQRQLLRAYTQASKETSSSPQTRR